MPNDGYRYLKKDQLPLFHVVKPNIEKRASSGRTKTLLNNIHTVLKNRAFLLTTLIFCMFLFSGTF